MPSTMRSKAFVAALIGLVLNSDCAAGSTHYVPNDIHCPANSYTTFVHNSYTYIAPVDKFIDITKSFFDNLWYDGSVVTNTTGTDNVPGATRSGPYGGSPYNDTLTMYTIHSDALMYSYHSTEPITYPGPPGQPALHIYGYAETMRFESICGGMATYIDLLTYVCSSDHNAAYQGWDVVHTRTFDAMATKIGAESLVGDCPQNEER
ncbi:hypothetical protein MSAN_00659400 [Mycena sanguinolenta]|uniref:Uncharacterized protein n=1 Tax=Mycena sanguinolenta TaxID=230812 RepID=A0A8H6Z5L0_9AGAR|nr:hypothetical protein MSAN_00659400 [Mycena sanguinolenta]